MSSFARSAKSLESHGIFVITRPSLQGADRSPESDDKYLVEWRLRPLTPPSLQADGDGVCGPGAVATAGCVRGNPHAVGDTGASTGDAGVASAVGSRVGWPGNRDPWPVWHAATGLFWPAGRPCWSRNVASSPGDSAARDTGNGHSEWGGSWLPPARSRPSPNPAFTGRIRTTSKGDAEGNTC